MTQAGPPDPHHDPQGQDPQGQQPENLLGEGVIDVPGPGPTPAAALPALSWNVAKKDAIKQRIEDAGLDWQDDIDEKYIDNLFRQARRAGDPELAAAVRAATVKRTPPLASAMGREQQERTRKSVDNQKAKERRGTVTNAQGRNVARKWPMTWVLGGGIGSALLLGVLIWAGVSSYNASAAKSAARVKAQQQANPAAQTVPGSDLNQVDSGAGANPVSETPVVPPVPGKTNATTPPKSAAAGTPGAGTAPPSNAQNTPTTQAGPPPDTTTAYNTGLRDGQLKGVSQGERDGYAQGKADGLKTAQASSGQTGGYTQVPSSGTALPVSGGAQPTGSAPAVVTPQATLVRPPQGKLTFTQGQGGNAAPGTQGGRLTFSGGASTGGQNGNTTGTASSGTGGAAGGSASGGDTGTGQGTGTSGKMSFVSAQGSQAPAQAQSFALKSASTTEGAGQANAANQGKLTFVTAASSPADSQSGNGATTSSATGAGATQDGASSGAAPAPQTGGTSASGTPAASSSAPATGNASGKAQNFGPYHPYQTIRARTQTATLILEGEKVALPVIAISSDGRKWIGTGTASQAQRINLLFSSVVDLDNATVLNVSAAAYDDSGNPGLQGSGKDLAPDLVRNLIRSAATGVQDFAQAQLSATTTTTAANGAVIVQKQAPSLWTLVGSRALTVFNLPNNTPTFTRATYLPAGTDIVLVVGAGPVNNAN